MDKYSEASKNLSQAIDIAIDAFKKHPLEIWDEKTMNHVINTFVEFKNNATNPEPQFRNLTSLKYVVNDVFTYFQEGSGDDVNAFWDRIKELNLPYKRENKLLKIIKRKKINSRVEYDFIIDVIIPYQQEKIINQDDVDLLNKLIAEFESKNKVG